VRVHPFTLSYTPMNMRCDSWASLLTCTLASPCFGHEPKARVATRMLELKKHKEKELWKMRIKYKNKMTKKLPIVTNLAHAIEFCELLNDNFIIIEQ
jgi:hypothetical protein